MEHAKKYALVSEDMMLKHVVNNKQLSELDKAMVKILNSTLSDNEKVYQYYWLLQKKMKMQEFNSSFKFQKPILQEKKEEEDISSPTHPKEEHLTEKEKPQNKYDEIILDSVMPSLKRKAGTALNIIKNQPEILSWNEKGEMSYHGLKIPGSNIADMFNLIFSDKKNTQLAGKDKFISALSELNVPKQYVRNKHLINSSVVKTSDISPIEKYLQTDIDISDVNPPNTKSKKLNVTNDMWESY